MLTQKQNIFWGIGLIVVVIGGIFLYRNLSSGSSTGSAVVGTDASQAAGQDILDLLNSFQSVTIDQSLFSDPNFQNLRDYSTSLPVEQQGRANPFAPIGSENATVQTKTVTVKK